MGDSTGWYRPPRCPPARPRRTSRTPSTLLADDAHVRCARRQLHLLPQQPHFGSWNTRTPQRVKRGTASAWCGTSTTTTWNHLRAMFPEGRLGPTGDVAKINCATCHQGVSKPLHGVSMLPDYPELAVKPTPAPPVDPARRSTRWRGRSGRRLWHRWPERSDGPLLAQPRGFCAGVTRAIEIVERALEIHGAPVYVFHEIVHNRHVVRDLEHQGAIFVDDIEVIPARRRDGVQRAWRGDAIVVRAAQAATTASSSTPPARWWPRCTCRSSATPGRDIEVVVIGHAGHDEVEGTLGQVDRRSAVVATLERRRAPADARGARVAYVTQTTLSVDDTRAMIDALQAPLSADRGPGHRRHLLRDAEPAACGAASWRPRWTWCWWSAPATARTRNRLREVAAQAGVPAYLIDEAARSSRRGWKVRGASGSPRVPRRPNIVDGVRERLREWASRVSESCRDARERDVPSPGSRPGRRDGTRAEPEPALSPASAAGEVA